MLKKVNITIFFFNYTKLGTLIHEFLISNFDPINIILSVWKFYQFFYMFLVALSQNFIGMGWKINALRMNILLRVDFKCTWCLATLMKALLAVVKLLGSCFCCYMLQKRFNYSQIPNWQATIRILSISLLETFDH